MANACALSRSEKIKLGTRGDIVLGMIPGKYIKPIRGYGSGKYECKSVNAKMKGLQIYHRCLSEKEIKLIQLVDAPVMVAEFAVVAE